MTTDTTSGRQKTDQVKDEGRHLTDEARSKGEQVGQQAKKQVGRVLDDARDKARHQANDQAHRAAGALREMANQLSSMADSSDEEGVMVDMANDGADRIRSVANHIDANGFDGIMNDIQGFARRRPGAFIAAGMGAGMLIGRFFRASDTESMKDAMTPGSDHEQSGQGSGRQLGGELTGRTDPLAPGAPKPISAQGPEQGRSI